MPTLPPPTNLDGSLRAFSPAEVAALQIQWKGVRDGSTPTLSFGINENRGEASCFINPTYFDMAVYYFVGHSKIYTAEEEVGEETVIVDKLSRLLPFRLPGRDGLVVTKITSMTGHKFKGKQNGGLTNWPDYDKVELKMLFETPKFRLKEDADTAMEYERYVEEDPGAATSDTIATYGTNFKFRRNPALPDPGDDPEGKPVNTNSVLKVQPKDTFTTTMWRVPEDMAHDDSDWMRKMYGEPNGGIGGEDIAGLIGCVNAITLHGRPPGTLLLKGARRFLDVSPLGDGTFEYRLEFTWETLPSGWLNLWFASPLAPGINDYYYVTTGAFKNVATEEVPDGECLYNVRDLRQAYQPGPYPGEEG